MTPKYRRPADWRRDVVQSVNYYRQIILRAPSDDRWAYSLMLDRGYPFKQAVACLYDAGDEGLIEWGVSARTAWLTTEGRALLHSEAVRA